MALKSFITLNSCLKQIAYTKYSVVFSLILLYLVFTKRTKPEFSFKEQDSFKHAFTN